MDDLERWHLARASARALLLYERASDEQQAKMREQAKAVVKASADLRAFDGKTEPRGLDLIGPIFRASAALLASLSGSWKSL